MNTVNSCSSLRGVIVAGIAALTLAGAAVSISPAQALPLSPVPAADASSGIAAQGVETIAYRRFYRHHRYYSHRRAVPCRGGLRTHLSKRYC